MISNLGGRKAGKSASGGMEVKRSAFDATVAEQNIFCECTASRQEKQKYKF